MSEPTHVAGRLEIPVEADLDGFATALKTKVEQIANAIKAKVGIEFEDTATLKGRLQTAVDTAAAGVTAKVKTKIDVDKDQVETAAKAAGTAVTKVLDKQGAEIKVEADDKASRQAVGIVARMKAWARTQSVEIPVNMGSPRGPTPGRNQFGPAGAAFRPTMMLGLLSVIQPAIALIMQSLGGLVAMLGSVGSSIYGLAGLVPMISALGAAFGAGMIAFSGWDAEGQQSVRSMRQMQREVKSLKGEWDQLTHSVRHSVWDNVVGELRPMAEHLLPALEVGLSKVGDALGLLMRDGLRKMNTTAFRRELITILDISASLTRDLGRGFGGLLLWFKDMTIAAGSFSLSMAGGFRDFGEWASTLLDTSVERLAFANWLKYAGEKATELGRVLKNTWDALGGVFRAGLDSGDRLMGTLEQVTARWDAWANSMSGQMKMKAWFDTAEEGTRAVGTLLAEIGKALVRLGDDPALAGMVQRITSELLPAFETFIGKLGRELGPVVIDFISNVLELLSHLSDAGGPLAVLVSGFNEMVKAFNGALDVVPGLSSALGLLVGAMMAMRPVQFVIAGVSGALLGLSKITGGTNKFMALAGLAALLTGLSASMDGSASAISALATSFGVLLLVGPKLTAFGNSVSTAVTKAKEMRALEEGLRNIGGSYSGVDLATGAITRSGDEAGRAAPKYGMMARASDGLKTAAKGLWTALGGPWGIAIAAATTVLTLWWQEKQKAKQASEELRATLDAETGAITENTRETQVKQLQDAGWLDKYAEWGGNVRDVTLALEGDTAARGRMKEVTDRVAASEGAWQRSWVDGKFLSRTQQVEQFGYVLEGSKATLDGVVASEEQLRQATEDTTAATEDANEESATAAERAYEEQRAKDALAGGVRALRDAYDDMLDKMREERELNMSAREAARERQDGFLRATEEAKRLSETYDGLSVALTKNGDAFDISHEAGLRLEGQFYDMTDDIVREMEAVDAAGGSQNDLTKIWQDGQQKLKAFAEQVGLSPAGLQALREATGMTDADLKILLASMEALPEEVKTEAKFETQEARDRAAALDKAFKDNPTEVKTHASVTGVEVGLDQLGGLKGGAEEVPKNVKTHAAVTGAEVGMTKLGGVKTAGQQVLKNVKTTVDTPGAVRSKEWLDNVRAAGGKIFKAVSTKVSTPGADSSKAALDRVTFAGGKIPEAKSTSVTAHTSRAYNGIWSVINALSLLRDRTVNVTTVHRQYNTAVANGAIFNADGGVHDGPTPAIARFAGGGMPLWEQRLQSRLRGGFKNVENHVAQILPAGAWRVWAEDETGGEAYVPLAPSKRRRSMQILEEVANRFGMALMPVAAQFAGGGMSVPVAASAPPTTRSPAAPSRGGPQVVFEDGSIRIENPTPEPASRSVATIVRSFTNDGLFGTGD